MRQSGSSRASAFDEFSTALRFLKVKTARLDGFVYCEEKIAIRPFNASTALPFLGHILVAATIVPLPYALSSTGLSQRTQDPNATGKPLIGAAGKVSDGIFWIVLSAAEADVARNLQLLSALVD